MARARLDLRVAWGNKIVFCLRFEFFSWKKMKGELGLYRKGNLRLLLWP